MHQFPTKSFVDIGFATDPTEGAYSASQTWFRGGAPGKGKKGGEGENGGVGVPECPNSDLASLYLLVTLWYCL